MLKKKRYSKSFIKGGITEAMQDDLFSSSVLVMGAGSLASGVIMNLAAMGVGKIKIIDSEVIEETSLSSQLIHNDKYIGRAKVISAKDWIREYNSDVKVEIDKVKLNEFNYLSAIQGYDIIVDCFNSMESSYMLNEIALRHNKILVFGSVQGFVGQVTTIVPRKTGCLNCVIRKPQMEFGAKEDEFATISSVSNVISSIQATEVLKIITGTGEPLLNKLITFDGTTSDFRMLIYSRNMGCEVCSKFQRESSLVDFGF